MNIKNAPWLLLFGRTLLFVLVQSIFALGLPVRGFNHRLGRWRSLVDVRRDHHQPDLPRRHDLPLPRGRQKLLGYFPHPA